jgi:hypothetical protein
VPTTYVLWVDAVEKSFDTIAVSLDAALVVATF